jgi:hypothetical protein
MSPRNITPQSRRLMTAWHSHSSKDNNSNPKELLLADSFFTLAILGNWFALQTSTVVAI